MGLGIRTRWHRSRVDWLNELRLFAPASSASTAGMLRLTAGSAANTFPLMVETLREAGAELLKPIPFEDFSAGAEDEAQVLGELLDYYGSDKVSHGYHQVYGKLLQDRTASKVVEVGLGSNNEDVPSNMSRAGRPGASVRAFRDFLPQAQIIGADIDRRILFAEDRIETIWVDQTDLASFSKLERRASGFSLLIDDGLHSPDANLAVLLFGLRTMSKTSCIVIEDIAPEALPIWQVLGASLPNRLNAKIVQARTSLMFVVREIE